MVLEAVRWAAAELSSTGRVGLKKEPAASIGSECPEPIRGKNLKNNFLG
jgi:hypothetical protein